MSPAPAHARQLAAGARGQRGFTLMEVLVSVVVFAIAIVGLVGIQSRSIESQRASVHLREAERVAQGVMADIQARGFFELAGQDFAGNVGPAIPYDDTTLDADQRTRDLRRPPADIADDVTVIGAVRRQYLVHRTVDWVFDPADPPANPPDLGGDDRLRIRALVLQVVVLWIDDTNPLFPPPAGVIVTDLDPTMVVPGNVAFRPWVGHVEFRTVRVNDAAMQIPPGFGGSGP